MTFFEDIVSTRKQILSAAQELRKVDALLEYLASRVQREFLEVGPVPADVQMIQELVGSHYGLSRPALCARNRVRSVALVRMLAIHLCRKFTIHTTATLGAAFNLDHTSISHAFHAVNNRLDTEPLFAKQYQTFCAQIAQRLALEKTA